MNILQEEKDYFGLDPNGRGHFNDTTNKIIEDIGKAYYWEDHKQCTTDGRYESKNRLVKLKDETSDSAKEYIFSVSSYHSLAELHDIDNNNFNTWLAIKFLGGPDEWRYVFSYQFSLLHYIESNTNIYYAAYVQYKGTHDDGKAYSVSYSLSKFTFNSLTDRSVSYKEISDNFDNRIVSAFIMPVYNKLMVFYFRDTTKYTDKGQVQLGKYTWELVGFTWNSNSPSIKAFADVGDKNYVELDFFMMDENNADAKTFLESFEYVGEKESK